MISLFRLACVPLVVGLILSGAWLEAFALFVLAGLSDALDGFLAKRFGLASRLGSYLDPVADKALLVCTFLTLAVMGAVWTPLVILIVSRDVMIVGGILLAWLLHHPIHIDPLLISKINTAAQLMLAGSILATRAYDFSLGTALNGLMVGVGLLTLASSAAYLRQWLRHMDVLGSADPLP
ncbi:MAG: CDP-alcohol phosphatidyltransferase family protein [Alphaproteobacteria bacterium]|nr:CDP-alcohol phosphatidyltransferase family protein [Alphaproteobacteria bacterium]